MVFKKHREAVMLALSQLPGYSMTITLYGTPLSLYTGKPRSYFIKAGLTYREIAATSAHYTEVVLPQAGMRRGIPVVETENGAVIRDSTAIIDHFEAETGHSFSPTSTKQRFVSRLLDVIGMEGLLRPAMHYRWDFPDQNDVMLKFHFSMLVPESMDRESLSAKTMDRMRAAGHGFGALPPAFPLIEQLYEQLLDKMTAHFSAYPYFLGYKPSIGDFGMMAPLYAHLGRDPAPLRLMQTRAVQVLRWVERMNRPELDQGEFTIQSDDFLAEDEIPATLIDVLRHIAIDFMPETRAAAAYTNQWLKDQTDLTAGSVADRAIGMSEFEVQGQTLKAIVQPYRFFLLQRVFAEYDAQDSAGRAELDALLQQCDMGDLMDLRINRSIGRADNLEIWQSP
ncbi:MAG: glutathione S-transferase [Candidatus Azotimanducaceae bacterium]|jgi:glutathione S-transferase